MIRMRRKHRINVLRGFNGHRDSAELVEVVERKLIRRRNCDKHGRRMGPEYELVSYKGKLHTVFRLHSPYPHVGCCINIED